MTKLRILGAFALFAVVCLFLPVRSSAQGGVIQSVTFGPMGTPKGGVAVTVCASGATVTNGVCSPAESDANCCFSDPGLTQRLPVLPAPNQLATILSDGLGNYTVWAAPGLYKVSYSGAGVNPTTLTIPVSCVPGAGCTGLGAQLNANNVFTGVNSFKNMGSIRWADQFASTDAAIADLPTGGTGGGTVFFKPGTYSCPTSIPQGVSLINPLNQSVTAPPQIWSKFNGAAFNSFSAGVGSQNMVKFSCSGSFTLSDVSQVQILGIVWDMGNAGNFVVKGVAWSNFAMAVVNVPTTLPAVNVIPDTTNSFNSHDDHFYYLLTEGGNIGLSLGATGSFFVTDLEFDWVLSLVDTQPAGTYIGIAHVANCDSTQIHRHSAFVTNAISNYEGEVFNTASTTADMDADSISVEQYEETMNGVPATCVSFLMNPSKGNFITTGDLGCPTTISVTAWSGKTPYTFFGHGANAGTPNVVQGNAVQAARFYTGMENATPLVSGDFAFSGGFGNTPNPSITALKGTDGAFQLTFTSGGAGLGANPTVILTFHDGTWNFPPVCTVSRGDANSPAGAYWAPTVPGTATTLTLNFIGTPSASTGYIASVNCVGKPN
jgi:hypothetical protein